ncbi:uroporphyrinogen-III synthase [Congregibacter litoralis]|uniref:Uroporphyrinogen-III synthase n=1 Tax=Congregibacter litoralis KT71 TaxID=314285 RepID=A4A9F8_9GAMM|nr:uroporphyrinogen-III synthase [Congregibacter litoralis]EAQ97125.1 Uroporphyrinogen-III synthase [Congregibacter litoralis KT71]
MTAEQRVLVTRPAGQADSLIGALSDAGFVPLHLPMLQIEPLDPLPGAQRQRLMDLDRYAHVIFVSANAARLGVERIRDYWPQLPQGQLYWAVGKSTALCLEAEGLDVRRPERDMSSEGLLAMPGLAELQSQRVLIVKGEGGRKFLEVKLRERGAEVDSLACYRRDYAAHDRQACRDLLGDHDLALILVSSGEGLERLTSLLQPEEHTNLAMTTLLVPSQRVAEQALGLGWTHVECAENASDAAMLAAATAWRTAHLGETQH